MSSDGSSSTGCTSGAATRVTDEYSGDGGGDGARPSDSSESARLIERRSSARAAATRERDEANTAPDNIT